MKRTIALGKKACIVCKEEFQPASGAQMTCSAECKAEAKAKGLNKRGPRKGVDPVLEQEEVGAAPDQKLGGGRVFFNGQEVQSSVPQQARRPQMPRSRPTNGPEDLPELELDLSPLENYMKALVRREIGSQTPSAGGPSGRGPEDAEGLRETIREIVQEELADKFRGLMGK